MTAEDEKRYGCVRFLTTGGKHDLILAQFLPALLQMLTKG